MSAMTGMANCCTTYKVVALVHVGGPRPHCKRYQFLAYQTCGNNSKYGLLHMTLPVEALIIVTDVIHVVLDEYS